jgi:RNA polymerase sigma factor (TIGR02999 family)
MTEDDPGNSPAITALIAAADQGDRAAADTLFAALYSELHRLARRELNRPAGAGVSVSVTTLLHEAYLDIAGRSGPVFPDRARFMGYASRVMRGLIINHARNRSAQKRGGLFEITSFSTDIADEAVDERRLTAISDALDELARNDASLAQVVDLKFFCGFTFSEIGVMRGVSERTVQRQWDRARIYLHRSLRDGSAMLDRQ